jgi:3-ketosteroid 9alpha-monooxygenase subunit A
MGRGFKDGHPNGWFQIGWSSDVEIGDVRPLKYFGRDLVMFRSESGVLSVLDAHCPHLGAHLGYGGVVDGESVVCPFHSWTWGTDGTSVSIPHSSFRTMKRRLACWTVVEQSGLILLWRDDEGREPSWFVPRVPEFEESDEFFRLHPEGTARDSARLYPQFVLENIVDFTHLSAVHLWNERPPELNGFEAVDQSFVAESTGVLSTGRGGLTMKVRNEAWGVGVVIAHISGLRDTVFVSGVTPIDDENSEIFCSTVVRRPSGVDADAFDSTTLAMIDAQNEAILGSNPGDRDIWEHQIYVSNPPLRRAEMEGFRALRRWSEQFYSEVDNE